MNKLIETAKEIDRILKSGIEIHPNSPIHEKLKQALNIACVTNRYLFWFEHEGKDGWTFEIEAKDYDEAYQKAYDTHGPQVDDMMYQLL